MTRLLEGGVGRGWVSTIGRWTTSLTSTPQLLQFKKFFKIFIKFLRSLRRKPSNAICLKGGELGNAHQGGLCG
jgi:hypothetical protein